MFRQVVAFRWADGASVMDFADFESARRCVDHPLHRRSVEDHATKVVGQRIVVRHDWVPESS